MIHFSYDCERSMHWNYIYWWFSFLSIWIHYHFFKINVHKSKFFNLNFVHAQFFFQFNDFILLQFFSLLFPYKLTSIYRLFSSWSASNFWVNAWIFNFLFILHFFALFLFLSNLDSFLLSLFVKSILSGALLFSNMII